MMSIESVNEIWEQNMNHIDLTLKPGEQMVVAFHGIPRYSVIEQGKLVGFCDREEAIERGLIEGADK